jgi:hypothetical protein
MIVALLSGTWLWRLQPNRTVDTCPVGGSRVHFFTSFPRWLKNTSAPSTAIAEYLLAPVPGAVPDDPKVPGDEVRHYPLGFFGARSSLSTWPAFWGNRTEVMAPSRNPHRPEDPMLPEQC